MKRFSKKVLGLAVAMCLLALPLLTACNKSGNVADVIVYSDNIYTANDSDEFVTAFAVKDGKYIAVGKAEDVDSYKGENTKVYNANFVMPGATESHGHFIIDEAFKLGCYIDIFKENGEGKTFDDILEELIAYADTHDVSNGLFAYQFNTGSNKDFTAGILPTKEQLDAVFKDIPVFVSESSIHAAWVNSKCLEMAGLLEKDTDTVSIDRYEDGEAIGILRDEACIYVKNKVFPSMLSTDKYKEAVKNAASFLNSLGYTAHYDMLSNFDEDEMYKSIYEVDKENALTCLFGSAYSIEAFKKDKYVEEISKAVELKNQYQSEHFKPTWIKLFADGVVEGGTGYVKKPYLDDPKNFGTQIWADETMTAIVNEANKKDMLVHVHTMGDAAVSEALDAFVDSKKNNGYYRNSLGHVGLIVEEDFQRIKENDFGVSSGANWASQITQAELDAVSGFLDEERVRSMYPYTQYPEYGIKAALSTDNPCMPGILDVFGYIQVLLNGLDHSRPINKDSITRRDKYITVGEALKMFTYNGAWMNNLENERGSIEVGKYADFVFADKDPFKENIDDIWKIKVENTFFEGKMVYSKE